MRSEKFARAFALAQHHLRAAMRRDELSELNLKKADECLQDAFEILPQAAHEAILRLQAKLERAPPSAPPKRMVGPQD